MKDHFKLGVSTYYIPLHEMEEEIRELDRAGADIFHVGFFDGNFVENIGMSLQDLAFVRRCTAKPVDVHLCFNRPIRFLPMLAECGADIVHIHPDADPQPAATLQEIRRLGMKAGIAVDPSTSMASVEALLPLTDYVLIMTVYPGFAGQSYLLYVDDKIVQFSREQERYGYQILLDGGITAEAVKRMKLHNVGMVLGTMLFDHPRSEYARIIQELKAL